MAIRVGIYPKLADEAWLREQYEVNGRSCPEIAALIGCTTGAVEYRLHRFGVKLRGRHHGRWNPKRCARCATEFTPAGPAAKFCSPECRAGTAICENCGQEFPRTPPQKIKGKTYPRKFCSLECRQAHWARTSRHRYVNQDGYVVRQISTMSRRTTARGYVEVNIGAVNSSGGRVLEHRWVMEQQIGRRLLPHEVVHHKNGVRADNDPANLELWSTSHPKGQRVEDKIAWAAEFLEQYGYNVTRQEAPPVA